MSVVDVQPQGSNGYALASALDESSLADARIALAEAHPRPGFVRRDTDQILSYYQSEHAGYPAEVNGEDHAPSSTRLKRQNSYRSNSSSEYSSDSPEPRVGSAEARTVHRKQESTVQSNHTRRPSVPTEGGADRRRVAIVEMDSDDSSVSSAHRTSRQTSDRASGPPTSLLSRRGHVGGLALFAPPDASPKTYTNLTPPPTAPIISDRPVDHAAISHHQRSASEAPQSVGHHRLHHKSSRDIGVVGLGAMATVSEHTSPGGGLTGQYMDGGRLKSLLFQTPSTSRPTTPAIRTPDLSDSNTSSFYTSYDVTPTSATYKDQELHTPGIGEGKDIQQPVVGPVVVGIDSSKVMRRQADGPTTYDRSGATSPTSPHPSPYARSTSPSSYLHYQPGIHATAGPLPPPPEPVCGVGSHLTPPPRPPRNRGLSPTVPKRDLEALKESLQLPQSVSNALAARSNPRPDLISRNTGLSSSSEYTGESDERPIAPELASDTRRSRSIHRREGAFPPSTLGTTTSTGSEAASESAQSSQHENPEDAPPRLVLTDNRNRTDLEGSEPRSSEELPDRRPALELHRETSWVSLRQHHSLSASPNGGKQKSLHRSLSPSTSIGTLSPPPPPPSKLSKSDNEGRSTSGGNPFKATLTNLKRFSALPRTPSLISIGRSSNTASDSHHSPTPSPPAVVPPPRVSSRPKIKSSWPNAMHCKDVTGKRTALERSLGYAAKINELALYDCGLGDWVLATRHRGTIRAGQNTIPSLVSSPTRPSSIPIATQPRHTSHGSITSQATFPKRSDAYTATDLSMRPIDDFAATASPPSILPYPSLASSPRSGPSRASTLILPSLTARSYQVPLATGGKGSTGFFASIGRKASLKKERGLGLSPPSPSKVLTKRMQNPNPNPRPVQVDAAPSVPGGPRTAPSRMRRSQTMSVTPTAPVVEQPVAKSASSNSAYRQSNSARRPSFFSRSTAVVTTSVQNPEFEEQVNRLSDLLPDAERSVLAGYLRRAGQDILAIGQYLEDEKNGTIRRD